MRLARTDPRLPSLPFWPPLLATRGPGAKSSGHAHHAMHLLVCREGLLSVELESKAHPLRAAGVLTGPDVFHAIDASDAEVLLVFVDPESDVGISLVRLLDGPVRLITDSERRSVLENADPLAIMQAAGVAWAERLVGVLGGPLRERPRNLHPRVKKLLRSLQTMPANADTSLEKLAESVGLSPSRLMHVFSESVGIPLRPYLAWLKIQRAAAAIVTGAALTEAAQEAGFADAAHMSRAFRRMFGMPPSALRSQLVQAR